MRRNTEAWFELSNSSVAVEVEIRPCLPRRAEGASSNPLIPLLSVARWVSKVSPHNGQLLAGREADSTVLNIGL